MQKNNRKLFNALIAAGAVSLFVTSNARADCGTNYSVTLQVMGATGGNGTTNCAGAATAQDFFNLLDSNGLRSISAAYTDTSVATATTNFNSLVMTMAFPTQGPELVFTIPALGISQSFTGVTRQDSKNQLEDYLKHQNNILGRILNYQAATSPTSPISGPGGLIQTITANDFDTSFTNSATNIAAPLSTASPASNKSSNLAGVGLQYGSMDILNNTIKTTTIPLSYTIRNNIDPRRQLSFNLPITVVETNGAKSYQAGLGASYHFPMNDNWTLTPAVKYSAVASADLATAASMYSASLTSTYIWNLDKYDVAMGNMLGYLKTGKFKAGDYSVDPGISNTVFRNGLLLSQPVELSGSKLSVEYSIIDTRYTGSAMYVNHTNEIGITLGTSKSAFSARSYLRGGVTYIFGKDTKGFTVNIGYWF
jgi:hypothetical protein